MEGFIQLHKKICDWEWYTDIPTCKLFFHILLKCNYKEASWKGIKINPWEFITSLEHLSLETWLSKQQIRTSIEKLKKTWEITHESTNNYTTLALNNWASYNTQDNKRITNEQQTDNKRITTTNKEYKEKKEYKENNTETDTIVSSQAIVHLDNKLDKRNQGTQRIIDIVTDAVQIEWYLYDNNKEERNRATIIAKRQSDWWAFVKEAPEEQEEQLIRAIIAYSNQNEYSAKIRSCKDFHEKWKKVANSMKQLNKKEQEISDIPTY